MAAFSRRLKVNKTDAFIVDVSSWANGEAITSLAVTEPDGSLVTIGASTFADALLTVSLTGVSTGVAEIHFDYTTATRSDCYKAIVVVVDGC